MENDEVIISYIIKVLKGNECYTYDWRNNI